MRFVFPLVYLVGFIAIIIALSVSWMGLSFRQFETFEDENALNCESVYGIHGAADLAEVPDTGVAYISSLDRRADAERGAILRFDTENPLDSSSWRDRTGGQPVVFQPMGLDLYTSILPDGRLLQRLFVVNFAGPEIVLYDIDANGDLVFREIFADPRMTSPNDVVATGPRSFYVTNDTPSDRQTIRGKIDFLLGLKVGEVLQYDGNSWSTAASGLAFPNGLALSNDGEMLYLAEMRGQRITQFVRNPETDGLRRVGSIKVGTFPDNVSVTSSGDVFVGGVPQPLSLSAYGEGLQDKAASHVFRIEEDGSVNTVLEDSGSLISAATTAVQVGRKILVGSRSADHFLMCDGSL